MTKIIVYFALVMILMLLSFPQGMHYPDAAGMKVLYMEMKAEDKR